MSKMFRINQVHEPELPLVKPEDTYISDEHFLCDNDSSESESKLYITEKVRSQIFDHIGWGSYTDSNNVEQGGILIGCTYYDEDQKLLYGVAEHSIPALSADGSMAYLKFHHSTWIEMTAQADEILDAPGNEHLQIIGWYHTHPGRLSVFMSGVDQNTQLRMFNCDWQFAIVLNPQKQIWKAFNGGNAIQCKGYMIKEIKREDHD